jgi:hypothetical protein
LAYGLSILAEQKQFHAKPAKAGREDSEEMVGSALLTRLRSIPLRALRLGVKSIFIFRFHSAKNGFKQHRHGDRYLASGTAGYRHCG